MSQQPKHPAVIALGVRSNISQKFVTVDRRAIAIAKGVTNTVDSVLKLYYVMNMQYADNAEHILHFLQRIVLTL